MRYTLCIILVIVFSVFAAFGQTIKVKAKTDSINQVDEKGLKQGLWIKKYPNGNINYEGYFKDDRPVKLMKRYFENGDIKSSFIFYDNDRACAAHHEQ